MISIPVRWYLYIGTAPRLPICTKFHFRQQTHVQCFGVKISDMGDYSMLRICILSQAHILYNHDIPILINVWVAQHKTSQALDMIINNSKIIAHPRHCTSVSNEKYPSMLYMSISRAHCINVFSMEIEIQWLFCFNVIPFLTLIPLQIIAHDTTAQLSCHVQNFAVCSDQFFRIWMWTKWNFHHIWNRMKLNVSEIGPCVTGCVWLAHYTCFVHWYCGTKLCNSTINKPKIMHCPWCQLCLHRWNQRLSLWQSWHLNNSQFSVHNVTIGNTISILKNTSNWDLLLPVNGIIWGSPQMVSFAVAP